MPTLDELLSDKNLPDTTPIKVGDTEVPLGSLRQFTSKQLEQVTERVKALDTRENEITKRQREILDLANKAQAAYERAQEAAKVAQPVAAGADPWADPWLSPVKKALDDRDKLITELSTKLKEIDTVKNNMASIWAEDRWDNEYDRIDWGKRESSKRPSRDDLVKFAGEQKLLDRRGIPSVKLAWERMSAEDRKADIEAAAEERGRQKGLNEAMAARIPPPGVPGAAPLPTATKTGDKGQLGDLYAEALADNELRALLEQLPNGIV